MARLFTRIAAFVLAISAASGVAAQSYTYTFYLGHTLIPGCTVQTPSGPVTKVTSRLQVTVTGGATPTVGNVVKADCVLNNFILPHTVPSTSAIGLNTGPGGSDVIEMRLPIAVVPTFGVRDVRAVVATSSTGSDVLFATVFTKSEESGAVAPKGVATPGAPITIPTMGVLGALLLGVLMLAIAWRTLRRRAHLLMLSLLFVAGAAWAVAIVVDGQVSDWASVTPSTDAAGDSTSGQAGIDLLRQYTTSHLQYGYLRVDVADLQNPPVANPGNATLLEDGSTTITLTGSDPGALPLTFQIASSPTKGTLGPVVPVNSTSATVLYTANADENGSDSFTFTVTNGTQTSAPATVSITITPVNDQPSFSAANPPAVNEGAGAQSVSGWATFDPGPANESSQAVLAYHVSNVSNPALFTAGPSVAANGTLTYTVAADASGTSTFDVAVQDNGGTANGGVDTSATQTFTITVNAVNDAPTFTGGGNVSALEDAAVQTVPGWATAINDGDADAVQTLGFQITGNTNAALFAAGPSVDAVTGNLTYTPAADANGSATITLVLSDNGGTANGGSDTSAPYNFDITITPVNDAPSFTAANPPAVNEGAGAQTVPNWATFDPGPANESSQTVLAYTVSNVGNPSLFAVAPAVAPNGTLTYTVAANVSGTSTFDVAVQDNGGTANGGVDTSATQTFTITVNAVNSAPTFTGGGNVSSDEDAGPQTFPAWATAIDDGDLDQVQTLTFSVTGNTNPSLFSAGPAVDPVTGNLTYTAATDTSGSATITLVLSDDGGTANGGDDTSAPYNFTITVNPINDAPSATPKAHSTHSAIEFEIVAAAHTGELLEGAADPDDPIGDLTAEYVAGSATPAGALVVVTNAADGSFRYDPPGGYSGAGSFQFRVCDDGAPQQCSAPATVTFNITGPELYFVDDSAAGGGDGGLNDPFDSLADLPPGRGTGDRIYLHSGTYANGHSLNAGEHLIGQGHSGNSDAHLGVVAVGNGTLDATPAAGAAPNVGGTVVFAGNNSLLRGVAVASGASTAVSAGAVSGITALESSLDATTTAANFNGTGASVAGVAFTSTTSSGGANGIVLNNIAGGFDFGTGTLSGHTGVAFLGTGTLGTTSYAGSISKNSAGNIVELNGVAAATDTGSVTLSGALSCNGCSGVDIVNRDAGTITFSGTTKTVNTGASTAVNLDNNDAATIHFTGGGLDIDSTTGVGFNAVNGAAAITVQAGVDPNTIDTTAAAALNVVGTTIGASNLNFLRVAAGNNNASADPLNGIVLDTTGASGGLTVTGDGTGVANGSGGLVQNTTGTGIKLFSTRSVSLSQLNIRNTGTGTPGVAGAEGHGIDIANVSGLTFQDASLVNTGAGNEEHGLRILNLTGTSLVEDVLLDDMAEDGVQIRHDVATAGNQTYRRLSFQDHKPGFGESGMEIRPDSNSQLSILIDDSDFALNANAVVGVSVSTPATHTGTLAVTAQANVFNGANAFGSGSLQVLGGGSGTETYGVLDNTVTGTKFDGLRINNDGTALTNSTITGNTVTGNNIDPPGLGANNGEGITLRQDENGTLRALIEDNDITLFNANAIHVQSSDDTSNDAGRELEATIRTNVATVRPVANGGFGAGVLIDVGDGSAIAKNDVCASITGNALSGTELAEFFDFDITLQLNETNDASLTMAHASEAAMAAANGGASTSAFANPPNAIVYDAGANCTLPP